ncbi:hypothetical protein [Chitinophaga sp. S165]|uniref:hypothetical protein n=1 Tax=Chitinophaga sp. S165 TaxID=2135462 RepID=UPI000D719D65|nr:hypothetical protein [Chitinophaga sp. S165]PWV48326.1 hypothetical protein C7475_107234 [Chitinophaga sp. S165]
MAPENSKAEQTHLASSPAADSQNLSGMSRQAVRPIQKMQTNNGPEDKHLLSVSDDHISENVPAVFPLQKKIDQSGTTDIQPFQLKGSDPVKQQVGPGAVSGAVVQRMVPKGLKWYTLVKINTGPDKGRVARILLPYINPGNPEQWGYFVSFVDNRFQWRFLSDELDLYDWDESDEEEVNVGGMQEMGEFDQQEMMELAPQVVNEEMTVGGMQEIGGFDQREIAEVKPQVVNEQQEEVMGGVEKHWTDELKRFSGVPAFRIAMLLQEKYGDQANEIYDGTSYNGVEKAIKEKAPIEYASLDELLTAAERLTEWGGKDGGALDDWIGKGFSIKELSYEELRELAKDASEIGPIQYNAPFALINDGLWTDGMGPCITVAMTATSEGKRYNALLHSMDLMAKGRTVIGAIIRLFDSTPELVPFNQLKDINFFVAGGDHSTAEKAESILEELARRKLPVAGRAIKSRVEDASLTKALVITAEGRVAYSMYNAKEVHRQ